MANEGPTTVGSIQAITSMDLDQWHRDVAEVQASARELGAISPTITVDANTSRAQEQMAAVDAAAAAMGVSATTSAAQVDAAAVTVSGAEGRTQTAAEKAAVANEALGAAERDSAKAAIEQAGAEEANSSALTQTGDAAEGAAGRTMLMVAAVVALIALAAPLSAAAAGIGGAFAGMGAAGVLAVIGVVQQIKNGTAAGQQWSAGLQSLKGDLDQLAGTAANGLLASFQSDVTAINEAMPELNSEIGGFASQLGGAASTALQGVINLFRIMNPLFVEGGQVIQQIADGFVRWTQDGGLQKFTDYAVQQLPIVVHDLGDIASAVLQVVEAAAPIGSAILAGFDGLAKAIGAIPVPVITAAATAALALWAAIKLGNGVGAVVDKVTASIGNLTGAEASAESGAVRMGSSIGAVAGWLGIAAAAFGVAVAAVDAWKQSVEDSVASQDDLVNAITSGTAAAGGYADAMKAVNAWNDTGKTTTGQLNDALESAANGWGGMNQAAADWFGTLDGGASVSGNVLNMLNKYGDALATVANTNLPAAVTSFKQFSDQYDLNATAQWRAINNMGQFKDALTNQATQMGVAASKTNLLAIANGTLSTSSQDASTSVDLSSLSIEDIKTTTDAATTATDAFSQALAGLGNVNLTADQANIKYQQSLADANAEIAKNGKGLDEATQAGRNNSTALDGIATSAVNLISAQAKQGVSETTLQSNMAASRQSFIKAAEAAGDTATQANNLADKYGLIPGNVSTAFKTSGAQDAIDKANKVAAAMAYIPHYVGVTVSTHGTMISNTGHLVAFAGGGTVNGPGSRTSDNVAAMLSATEEVTSNDRGQADRWRPLLKMVNADAPAGQIAGKAMQLAGVQASQPAPVVRNVTLNMNLSNPVSRDPVQDVRAAGQALVSAMGLGGLAA